MKVYLHWDEAEFTKVLRVAPGVSVDELRSQFWDALCLKHPDLRASTGGVSALQLKDARGRPVPLTSRVGDIALDGDDLRVGTAPAARGSAVPPSAGQEADQRTGSSGHAGLGAQPAAPAVRAAHDAASTAPEARSTSAPAVVVAAVADSPLPPAPPPPAVTQPGHEGGAAPSKATTAAAAQRAVAREQLAPVVRALWKQAEEAAAAQSFRGAAEVLQQALLLPAGAAMAQSTRVRLARLWLGAGNAAAAVRWALQAAEGRPEDAEVLELAGDCLRLGRRPREAAEHYQSALEVLEESQAYGAAPLDASELARAQLRLRLSLAACLYDIPGSTSTPSQGSGTTSYDNQDLAASLVMSALEQEPASWDALRLYGRIALDRGMQDDALRVALRLVVQRPSHAGAKGLLAECLQDDAGCGLLYQELGVPPPTPPQAGSGASSSAASSSGSSGGWCAGVDAEKRSSAAAALGFVATAVKDNGKVDSCIALLRAAVALEPGSASYALNLAHALELRQELGAAVAVGRGYCARAGSVLAGLPLKVWASTVELHTTLIRNEAAYFGCVLQLLRGQPPPTAAWSLPPPDAPSPVPQPPAASLPPLFLCGDSHCLSAAWRVVTLRGERRLLRPLLVTGCKLWHLRPASVFYPKAQFEAAIRMLPQGAQVCELVAKRRTVRSCCPCAGWQVVLLLGEIDCREGLLLAVQKGKYEAVSEGIAATVAIYLDLARSLLADPRALELLIHPLPPVLNETRHIVQPFAAALRAAVAGARAADAALAARLHYLDFFDTLLTAEGGETREAVEGGKGYTALHFASFNGRTETVKALLQAGTDVAAKDNYGSTALHWASKAGHKEVVEALLQAEADVAAKNKAGETPLVWAKEYGKEDIAKMVALLQGGTRK
ncbi:E3 ubiquitin-protein ligase [Tetrabaena socialis]|uniref:E3 ubiquitin-protein ligase n=1 Tax=Tetrabaena socialis TaxID=47790 RepID=A0A2J8AF93_9CHLO|nr:E3 ubiquitin-protein ligase [Tetrabaena socialis]|eukprot:PNH11189.1 E3 ubiquitin-protein ligase [Tetrabaena socialis]